MSMIVLHVLEPERVEEDDLVDAVEELRPEVLPQRLGHLPPHAFAVPSCRRDVSRR